MADPPKVLDYRTAPPRARVGYALLAGVPFGLLQGFVWFAIGEGLDNVVGNMVAWFVLPAILPVVLAAVYFFASTRDRRIKLIEASVFATSFYFWHHGPMGVVILGYSLLSSLTGSR